MSEENASATATEALAETTSGTGDATYEPTPGPMSKIESFFAEQEAGNQVDNLGEDGQQTADGTQQEQETEAQANETATDDAAKADATGEAKAGTSDAAETEETANFKALEGGDDQPILDTVEALKAEFPRNSSKELLERTAQYGAMAKRGQEVISALGGEDFVPGATTIVNAIKEGNPRDILVGIATTGGPEEALKVVADSINMALLQSDQMLEDPQTKPFATALKQLVDAGLRDRFGSNMTADRMQQLAMWDQAGWFDKIQEWVKSDYIDPAEVQELLEASESPESSRLAYENRELKRQLEGKNAKAETPKSGEDAGGNGSQVDNSFDTLAAEGIGKTLGDVVLKNSVLRPLDTDSPDIKEAKTVLRDLLNQTAATHFRSSEGYTKLLQAYRTGKRDTAVFKSDLSSALSQSILAAQPQTAVFERLIARAMGRSRNAQLGKRTPVNANQGNNASNAGETQKAPTQTEQPATKPKTREEVFGSLAERIAAIGG